MSIATRERPILFSGPMVRAIQDGRKTQTRRAVKLRKGQEIEHGAVFSATDPFWMVWPYGKAGDRLWVRETWALIRPWEDSSPEPWLGPIPKEKPAGWVVVYREGGEFDDHFDDRGFNWRPSIFMPRWASRTTLEITDIRIERLHDISEENAIAEGFDIKTCGQVFRKAAGKAQQEYGRWLEYENGGEPATDGYGYWCLNCVEKAAQHHKAIVCGWNECFENDSASRCDECGTLIHHSLTKYGAETELGLTDNRATIWPHLPVSGDSALVLAELAEGMGDLREEHHGRMAQIGFATIWESLNGPGSWAANPWVWSITFKQVGANA